MTLALDAPPRRGRPRLYKQGMTEVKMFLPNDVYDACCREALARSVDLTVVFREAIIRSRRERGEIRW